MARNTHATCRAILMHLQGRGFEKEASRKDVTESVSRIAGDTRPTRDRYMKFLKKYKYIEQIGPALYRLNTVMIDDDSESSITAELATRMSRVETFIAKMQKGE